MRETLEAGHGRGEHARRAGWWWALRARYDGDAMRPAPPIPFARPWTGPSGERQQQAWQELERWCMAGAGSGRVPFWRPWAAPDVPQRFAVGLLVGASGTGKSHLAEALSRQLDGDDRLQALPSPGARLRWRLQLKWQDCQWWRARRPEDPWDCGYLVEGAAMQQRLAAFRPRRRTLMVADALAPPVLQASIRTLREQQRGYAHPVRLLVIDTAVPGPLTPSALGDGCGDTAVFDLGGQARDAIA